MALPPALSAAVQALGLGKASAVPLGSGLADQAKKDLMTRQQYQQHVMDANLNGQTPMSFEEFQKSLQKKGAAQGSSSPAAQDLGMGGS